MEKEAKKRNAPVFEKFKIVDKDPFKIFVFAFLSSRTKDETTIKVCKKFFKEIKSFEELKKTKIEKIESLLFGVGFYKQKAKNLKKCAKIILEKYKGKIPESIEELKKLPGVGTKIAKVILNELYEKPFIAVDVHVHRISNRIGIISTNKIDESDKILEKIIPEHLKIKFNRVLVAYGQTICKPKNPLCKECKIKSICKFYLNNG